MITFYTIVRACKAQKAIPGPAFGVVAALVYSAFLNTGLKAASNDLSDARSLMQNGRFSQALASIGSCSHGNAGCYNLKGICQMALGRYNDAGASFERGLNLLEGGYDSGHYEPQRLLKSLLNNLALARQYTGQSGQAHDLRIRLLAHEKDNATYLANLGALLYEQKRNDQAGKTLTAALLYKPQHHHFFAMLYLGRLAHDRGEYSEAVRWYSKGMQNNPYSFDLYIHRSQAFYRLGQNNLALADLAMADNLIPGNARTENLRRLFTSQKGSEK